MESEEFKRINIDDCYIDWKHYLVEEEDGSTTIEDWSGDSERVLKEWMEDECACDEFWHADQEKCYLYFIYKNGFSRSKYAEYAKQHNFSDKNIAFWGLTGMFNDGWIKSPAFVDWNAMGYCISFQSIMNFLQEIVEPQTRVEILAYLIKSAELIYGKWGKKELTPILKDLLETQKAASKVRKQELARQAAEERAKNTPRKEKPEYVLSVEEIIQYVCEEDVDARQVVSRMLRYFADEKKGWNIKAIKALMEPMKTQQVIFNAPVGQVNNNVEHQKNSLK